MLKKATRGCTTVRDGGENSLSSATCRVKVATMRAAGRDRHGAEKEGNPADWKVLEKNFGSDR